MQALIIYSGGQSGASAPPHPSWIVEKLKALPPYPLLLPFVLFSLKLHRLFAIVFFYSCKYGVQHSFRVCSLHTSCDSDGVLSPNRSLLLVLASLYVPLTRHYLPLIGLANVANNWLYIDSGEIHSKSGGTTESQCPTSS